MSTHTLSFTMPSFPDLAGHTALVTGAGAGIGQSIKQALVDQGCHVVGLDRAPGPSGKGYQPVAVDLRDADALKAAFAALPTNHLDHVVNCAGLDPFVSIDQADAAAWSAVLDLDLRAYHLVIHHAMDRLRAGVGRSIVNVSSINYRLGVPGRGLYSVAKTAILGLTRGLARELGAEGMRVNAVSPGWIFTERQRQTYFEGPDAEKHRATLNRNQALQLELQPLDVASHVLFYLSAASRGSTGHNCVVDAGWLLE